MDGGSPGGPLAGDEALERGSLRGERVERRHGSLRGARGLGGRSAAATSARRGLAGEDRRRRALGPEADRAPRGEPRPRNFANFSLNSLKQNNSCR